MEKERTNTLKSIVHYISLVVSYLIHEADDDGGDVPESCPGDNNQLPEEGDHIIFETYIDNPYIDSSRINN